MKDSIHRFKSEGIEIKVPTKGIEMNISHLSTKEKEDFFKYIKELGWKTRKELEESE